MPTTPYPYAYVSGEQADASAEKCFYPMLALSTLSPSCCIHGGGELFCYVSGKQADASTEKGFY